MSDENMASAPPEATTEPKPINRAYPPPAAVPTQVAAQDIRFFPRHAGTPRQFECTRLITAEAVKDTIRRIPAFKQQHTPATILPHTRVGRARES